MYHIMEMYRTSLLAENNHRKEIQSNDTILASTLWQVDGCGAECSVSAGLSVFCKIGKKTNEVEIETKKGQISMIWRIHGHRA